MAYDTAYFDDIFNNLLGSIGATGNGMNPMAFAPMPPVAPSVPMPMARPPEADMPMQQPMGMSRDISMGGPAPSPEPNPMAAMGMAPQMMPDRPMGGQPDAGILGSLFGMSPEGARSLRGSIAGGMKGIAEGWNKPGLAAFASGAGGALEGAEKADQYQDKRGDLARAEDRAEQIKLIETAIKARAEGRKDEYQKAIIELKTRELDEVKKAAAATAAVRAQTDADYRSGKLDVDRQRAQTDQIYKEGRYAIGDRNATTREKDSEAYRNNIERGTARSEQKSKIEVDRLLERARITADKAAGLDQPGLSDKERVKRKAEADAAYKARESDILTRMAPTTPAMPAAPTPAKPGEISMMGNGTQVQPYRPTTPEEYAEIPAGSHYVKNGKIYRKRED